MAFPFALSLTIGLGSAMALAASAAQAPKRARDFGIAPGVLRPGPLNAITDVPEEAVYNSLFAATRTSGCAGHTVEALPVDKVIEICRRYNAVRESK